MQPSQASSSFKVTVLYWPHSIHPHIFRCGTLGGLMTYLPEATLHWGEFVHEWHSSLLPHVGPLFNLCTCLVIYHLLHTGPTWTKLSPLCNWCWNPSFRASGAKPYHSWSQLTVMWLPTFECTTHMHSPPSLPPQITLQSFSEWTWCCQICTVCRWAGMPQY